MIGKRDAQAMIATTLATTRIAHRGRCYQIRYFVRPGTLAPILYLHGLGSTMEDFRSAGNEVALSEHTLVGFDFPGCGGSEYHTDTPLTIDDLVAMTQRIVDNLALSDLTVIGHSLGGLAGLQYVRRHPERVAGFVSVEGNLASEDCDILSRDVFRQRFLGDEDRFFSDLERRLSDPRRVGFGRFAAALRGNVDDRAYFDYCRSIVDYSDWVPLLQQFLDLPRPRAFVHGESNSNLSYLGCLRDAGVPVISIPESDHFPALTNPHYFWVAISRLLEGRA